MTCAKVAGQIEITETAWVGRRLGFDGLHRADQMSEVSTRRSTCVEDLRHLRSTSSSGLNPLENRAMLRCTDVGMPRNGSMMSSCSGAVGGIASAIKLLMSKTEFGMKRDV